jgi:haloalkane dehalogenase
MTTSESWRAEYPFASNFMELSPGVRLHYLDEGSISSTESASTILCVHGNPTWSFYYRSIVSHFAARNRVVALDHIGCGLSDKPLRYNFTLHQHTQNLLQLIDRLDLTNITLVVHDWGGAIGLNAAIQRADRIQNILVLNTAAFPPPYIPLRIAACRIPWLGPWAIKYMNLFAWTATFMAIDRLPRLSSTAKQGLLAPYDSPAHRIAINAFVQDIPMRRSHPTWSVLDELEHGLSRLEKCRVHFVWGMKDWCFLPSCMERMSQYWPQSTRRELNDVGHYVMEEAPLEVRQELEALLQPARTKDS